jgi:hypothetical protein
VRGNGTSLLDRTRSHAVDEHAGDDARRVLDVLGPRQLAAATMDDAGAAVSMRYVLSMFEHAHQVLMMALLPGPVGVL